MGSWGLIFGRTYNKIIWPFCDFVKISFYTTIREGQTDTHRHMDTQTHIPTYRPNWPRGHVSVLGI